MNVHNHHVGLRMSLIQGKTHFFILLLSMLIIIHSSRRVVFIDTDKIPALEERVMERVQNPSEAKMVLQLAETLVAAGVPQQELAVISIYRSQLRLISPGLRGTPDVEVATIDKYQGRDKECILVSLVRSNEQGNVSISLFGLFVMNMGIWHLYY